MAKRLLDGHLVQLSPEPAPPSRPPTRHLTHFLLVRLYALRAGLVGLARSDSLSFHPVVASGDCEAWPYLDQGVLRPSRSRKVCMTCHWFRQHAGPECIPVLTCQLHHGLIAHGEHLIRRCQGWTDDMARQQGWAPEVG